MLHDGIVLVTLVVFAAMAAPAQCTPHKSIDARDCVVGSDGFCVDSVDFMAQPNDDSLTLLDNDLLAYATLPAADSMDESWILSDPFATTLGTEDIGITEDPYSLFSDYNDLNGFQLAANDRQSCSCPVGISSTQVSFCISFR